MTPGKLSTPWRRLDRISAFIAAPMDFAAAILIAAIMLHVVIDVTSRLILRQSLEGTTEIVSYYYMVGVVFLPLLAVRRAREFITADILSAFMSRKMEKALDICADLLLAGWFGFFTWVTGETAIRSTQSGEFVETTTNLLTTWPSRWILPLVGIVVALYCLIDALRLAFDPTYTRAATESHEQEGAAQ